MQVAAVCVVFGLCELLAYDCHFRSLRSFLHSLLASAKRSRCMHAPLATVYLLIWDLECTDLFLGDEQGSNGLVWCCNGDAR
jgi:hypothetical protein